MISKLTLGTAQLGQKYGIANTTGEPSERTSFEILSTAFDNGINCIDTAPVYGNSEEIIGKYLKHHPTKCTIVSKCPLSLIKGKEQVDKLHMWAAKSIVDTGDVGIDIYLIRDPMEIGRWYDELLKMKRQRYFKTLGVTVYEPKELEYALQFDKIEAFQIPINLFDHRFIPYLSRLKYKTVFARSIFLQGYLLLENNHTKKLKRICNDFGANIREVAISFVRDLADVNSLVIGAETVSQVLDNVELIKSPPIPDNLRNYIYKEFATMPLEIIDPRRWKK